MTQQPSTLLISQLEHARVATIDGEIDMATADHLERALTNAVEAADLVIDLSACTFIDSSGVRALVTTMRAAKRLDRGLVLVMPEGKARTVLELTRVVDAIAGYESREDALRALTS
jgi:anti-sigma B factor antagonist